VSVSAELIVSPVPRVALSIEEACAALGVSWDTWDEHIAPHVKIVRIGRRKLVPVAELERWLVKEAERQRLPSARAPDGDDRQRRPFAGTRATRKPEDAA
jgi:hypothetical protein